MDAFHTLFGHGQENIRESSVLLPFIYFYYYFFLPQMFSCILMRTAGSNRGANVKPKLARSGTTTECLGGRKGGTFYTVLRFERASKHGSANLSNPLNPTVIPRPPFSPTHTANHVIIAFDEIHSGINHFFHIAASTSAPLVFTVFIKPLASNPLGFSGHKTCTGLQPISIHVRV